MHIGISCGHRQWALRAWEREEMGEGWKMLMGEKRKTYVTLSTIKIKKKKNAPGSASPLCSHLIQPRKTNKPKRSCNGAKMGGERRNDCQLLGERGFLIQREL